MLARYTALFLLVGLLVGCAPLASLVPGSSAAKGRASELTIIYTGYGRGNVYPQPECE
jgi:hypothetical protein